jgi:hypothetical protein
MKFYIIALLVFASGIAKAESFSEKVRVTGFNCDSGKAVIQLRSFEQDRTLYLASNESGAPKHFEMLEEHCRGLIKNLKARLNGKIFDLNFLNERFSRTEYVYVPPRNPCRPGRTKCDDEGSYVEKTFEYQRTETLVNGYRFFSEQKTRM